MNYDYRINIGAGVFVLAALLAIIDNNYYNKFPGNKSSGGKPGEEFKNRVINLKM